MKEISMALKLGALILGGEGGTATLSQGLGTHVQDQTYVGGHELERQQRGDSHSAGSSARCDDRDKQGQLTWGCKWHSART